MRALLIGMVLLLTGCATWGQREAQVISPRGETWRVLCQNDGRLDFKQGDTSISVDNRGKQSVWEQIMGVLMLSTVGAAKEVAK